MSKTKKIIIIVALSLVGLLIATTVLLACLPKQYYDGVFNTTTAKADYIGVYRNGYHNDYDNQSNTYKQIEKLYKASTKENVLLSIFEGTGSFDESIEKYTTNLTLNNSENIYIAFVYNDKQTLNWQGKPYKVNNSEVEFDHLFVTVENDSNFMASISIYVCNDTGSNVTYKSATPMYKITTVAKQHKLVEFINGLTDLSSNA